MGNNLLGSIALFVTAVIAKLGYIGIIILMGLESANIPIPSEFIMPAAGYLVYQGKMNLLLVALMGALGCLIGSLLSYALGYYGGRPFVQKYGKYLLLKEEDLTYGDKLFAKYGDKISFFSRLLPIVRTFISFPAGVLRTNLKMFAIYTFLGSFIWSLALAYVGEKIGSNQKVLGAFFHKFDLVIEILLVLGIAFYIYTHVKRIIEKKK